MCPIEEGVDVEDILASQLRRHRSSDEKPWWYISFSTMIALAAVLISVIIPTATTAWSASQERNNALYSIQTLKDRSEVLANSKADKKDLETAVNLLIAELKAMREVHQIELEGINKRLEKIEKKLDGR